MLQQKGSALSYLGKATKLPSQVAMYPVLEYLGAELLSPRSPQPSPKYPLLGTLNPLRGTPNPLLGTLNPAQLRT
eukprot:3589911-Rhodomonas_salina.6